VSKATLAGWNTIRVIGVARAFSILGDEFAIFALLLREKHGGGGALPIAVIFATGHLPMILLAPLAGTVADRVPVRILAPVVNVGQAIFAAMLAFDSPLPVSLLLLLLIGSGQAFTAPAWTATLPEIVDKDALPRALSLIQALYSMAWIAGPGLAGLMVSQLGYATPMFINAFTFMIVAMVPAFLALPFHAREQGPRQAGDLWAGLQAIRTVPIIRATTLLMFTLTLSVNAFNVADLFFALDDLHASTFIFGLTASTFSGGMLIAGLVNERRDVREARIPFNIIIGALMLGSGIFLLGLSWHWALLFPTSALAGIGSSTVTAYGFGFIVKHAPDEIRGRVLSAVQALFAGATLGALGLAGLIIPIIGPRAAILLGGAASLLAIALCAPALKRSVAFSAADPQSDEQRVTDLSPEERE